MRRFYSIGEKRRILRQQDRESLNNSQIAALHGVTPTQIRRWNFYVGMLEVLSVLDILLLILYIAGVGKPGER